jgi:hypothetical protein
MKKGLSTYTQQTSGLNNRIELNKSLVEPRWSISQSRLEGKYDLSPLPMWFTVLTILRLGSSHTNRFLHLWRFALANQTYATLPALTRIAISSLISGVSVFQRSFLSKKLKWLKAQSDKYQTSTRCWVETRITQYCQDSCRYFFY